MYIGSTDTRGLMHCLWEIIDNGVDEALAGAAQRVEVTLHPDDSVEVYDDGRGIPTDKEPKTGLPGVEVVCDQAARRRQVRRRLVQRHRRPARRRASGRQRAVVPDGHRRRPLAGRQGLSFQRGFPGVFDGDGPGRGVRAEVRADPQGQPRRQGEVRHPDPLLARPADLHQGRHVRVRGAARPRPADVVHRARPRAGDPRPARTPSPVEEKFRHDGGIAEFAEFLAADEPVTDILRLQGMDTFTETVPLLDDKGHMTPQEVERELHVDVAVRWGTGYDTELRSFVNVIATPKGGTHVSGFEQAVTKTFNDVMRATKALKVNDADVIKDDVLEGLTGVVTVRLAEPQFEGQTKEILGTPAARSVVRKVVTGGAEEVPDLHQAGREGPGQAGHGEGRRARSGPGSRPASTRRPSAGRTPWSPPRCPPSSPTAGPPTTTAPSCSSSRVTPRWAPPSWPATPSSRRCCRSAARS